MRGPNHIEADCLFIREELESEDITARFVNFSEQLVDIFTKLLRGPSIFAKS